jgi:hypothetical protein
MVEEIRNKVAESGLITLSLEDFYPEGKRMDLDIADWLFERMILKEKDFRQKVKEHNWDQYKDAFVAVYSGEEAIIPQWAYMLLGTALAGKAKRTVFGTPADLELVLMEESLSKADLSSYKDQRVILKGCSDLDIPAHAYLRFAELLQSEVKALMFGEACSTVPIYKKPRK